VKWKIEPASPEEMAFAVEANKLLADIGAKISVFTMLDQEDGTRAYNVTFQCGSKRHSITSEAPFHYDPPADVAERVKQWIAGVRTERRWSTEIPADLE